MVYYNCALYMLLYKQCHGFYYCSKRVVNARSVFQEHHLVWGGSEVQLMINLPNDGATLQLSLCVCLCVCCHSCQCSLYKNKNIFEKMSGYVGFLPPPTYFLHTLLGLQHAIVNDHSVYVGSMWVGVRILHIHSFFRKCFYSCLGSFLYIHMHIHLVKEVGCRHSMYRSE